MLKPESLSDIIEQAERASYMMTAIRGALLAPENRKTAPTFNATQLAALCDVDRNQIVYRIGKGDLPVGKINESGNRREFSLAETLPWVREYRAKQLRPEGAEAVCIAVANFKGGVGKTTTAMTLAQGLSLKGHRVLVIDCDPQGSLTTLFGILPDTEVDDEHTILPVCLGLETSIEPAIQSTYWSGLDLVCAAPLLFAAEFGLPARQMNEEGFEFWNVLNVALDDIRDRYDVIIIDTPPALSYVTINALMASDGILMPLPPNALDAASAAQFWRLFSDLAGQLVEQRGVTKEFDFVRVLLTRVDSQDSTAATVRDWINKTYEGKVLPAEIPKTTVAASSSAEFGTIYDVGKYEGNQRTYKRALDAYDRVTELLEEIIRATWRRHISA
ncbi:MAG: AAA family ATPase [Polaromonas sp.]|nr:AAA family ATPase [Polaromonas sp.]